MPALTDFQIWASILTPVIAIGVRVWIYFRQASTSQVGQALRDKAHQAIEAVPDGAQGWDDIKRVHALMVAYVRGFTHPATAIVNLAMWFAVIGPLLILMLLGTSLGLRTGGVQEIMAAEYSTLSLPQQALVVAFTSLGSVITFLTFIVLFMLLLAALAYWAQHDAVTTRLSIALQTVMRNEVEAMETKLGLEPPVRPGEKWWRSISEVLTRRSKK